MEVFDQEQNAAQARVSFVDRLALLPLVQSAVETSLNLVKKARETHRLLDYTITTTMVAAVLAAEKAKPAVNKLGTPIGYIDCLACKTLNKLEQSAPIIKMTPEEIYDIDVVKRALTRYNSLKNYSLEKVDAIKDYGMKTATNFANTKCGHLVVRNVDGLLLKVNGYVDDYFPIMPELEGDNQEQEPEPQLDVDVLDIDANTIEKAIFVSLKLRRRLYHHALLKLSSIHKEADLILTRLDFIFEMARNVRADFNDGVNELKERFQKLWDDIVKCGAADDEQINIEQRVFYLAKLLTVQLNCVFQKAASTLNQFSEALRQTLGSKIAAVWGFVRDLLNQLFKVRSLGDLSALVIAQLQKIVQQLKLCWASIYEAATRRPIEWARVMRTHNGRIPSNEDDLHDAIGNDD